MEENNVSVGIRVLGLITRDDLPNWEHNLGGICFNYSTSVNVSM